jgi:release factor glutamine methyltransferase
MGQIHKNVLDYEPHLALFVSDEAPLIFYKAIADYALKCLKTDGKLYFEINEYLADETMQILLQKGFNSVEVFKDINGKNRILRGKM